MQKLNWRPKTALEKAGLKIVQLLNKEHFQAFWVGGAVRNRLLKLVSDNLDIATDALPEEVEAVLTKANIFYKTVGKAFGTILALVNGQQIEITTFRRESRYSDQRHPDRVEFIREYLDDARRRDLTINALYFDPVTQQLFDPVNGGADVSRKIIRFVGDPKKRIDEDALRMLRAIRFAATLGFKLEKNSFAAIKTRAKFIQGISGERVKSELDKLLLSQNRTEGIRLLDKSGLLKFILPEFLELKKVFHGSNKFHLEGHVYDHTLLAIGAAGDDLDVIYAMVFHDIGKIKVGQPGFKNGEWVNIFHGHQQQSQKIFNQFASKYRFSRQSRELVEWLILHHDDRPNYPKMTEENRIRYSLQPDFPKLIQVWKADSKANIRLDLKGVPKSGNSESYRLGLRVLRRINSKQGLIKKLSNGNLIMQETNLPASIRIGEIAEKMKVKIVSGEIKNLIDAKKFLKRYRK